MSDLLLQELAPTGVLRAAINMSNFLLVSGETATGEPDGVSPDLARAIAEKLGVDLELIPFKGPGELADAAADDVWDIGNIAEEPERAKTIQFSPAYCEIQATYLLPPDSPIKHIDQVDAVGHRIAVKDRAAYDLWLEDHIKAATLVKTDTLDDSFEVFARDKLEVLAGLRPKLIEQQALMPGSVVMSESFTAIRQAVGCRPGRGRAAEFLHEFIQRSVDNGFIESLIVKHGVQGRLAVAQLVT